MAPCDRCEELRRRIRAAFERGEAWVLSYTPRKEPKESETDEPKK